MTEINNNKPLSNFKHKVYQQIRLLESEKDNIALKILMVITFIGFIGIVLYSTKALKEGPGEPDLSFRGILFAGFFTSMAALTVGALTGFIFGIPRHMQGDNIRNSTFGTNTNLEQISDWLTKILVGLGLTQITQIPQVVNNLGIALKSSLGDDPAAEIIGMTCCIFFSTSGFLMGYLWTRIYFRQMLERSEAQADSISIKLFKDSMSLKDEYMDYGVPTKEEFINAKINSNDPQKDKWGGKLINNNRIISATIATVSYNSDLFKVSIDVKSLDEIVYPLKGKVKFYLHPTFRNSTAEVDVIEGVARLNFLAWGAFTVGAELDKGDTKLEIDLAEVETAPELFKSR